MYWEARRSLVITGIWAAITEELPGAKLIYWQKGEPCRAPGHDAVGLDFHMEPLRHQCQPVIDHCPGRKPPFWAAKRPVLPHKTAIESAFTVENAQAAEKPREGPDRRRRRRR
jgi:hypothetical protein